MVLSEANNWSNSQEIPRRLWNQKAYCHEDGIFLGYSAVQSR
jgi:hypothetical protein